MPEIIILPPNIKYKRIKENTVKDEIVFNNKFSKTQEKMFSLIDKLSPTEREVWGSIITIIIPLAIVCWLITFIL